MARPIALQPKWESAKNRWVVNIPASISPTGLRRREYYSHEKEALDRCRKLKGLQRKTARVVQEAGTGLIASAVSFDELFRTLYGFENGLVEACEKYMRYLDEHHQSKIFGELVQSYEDAAGGNWSKGRWNGWRWLRNNVAELENETLMGLGSDFWNDWITRKTAEKGWSETSHNDALGMLSSVWKHAVLQGKADRNPIEGVRRKKKRKKEVAVYTVNEVKRLLHCAKNNDEDLLPYYAIAIFAGLRPGSEMKSLIWEDVNFEEGWIRVGANFDNKTQTKRFVPMEANLTAWLRPWIQSKGKVVPTNLRKRRENIEHGKYQALPGANRADWSPLVRCGKEFRDITRHTYGSYLEGKYRDRNIVKENMGHSSFETYEQHYRNARSPKEAEEFWNIVPKGE